MITLDELKEQLKPYKLSRIAKGAGIHYNTIYAIAKGTGNPRYETITKLVTYMKKERLII
jgi:DNA-binding phage protein